MEKYKAQLETINASLKLNPGNEKLLGLKDKIEKLLELKKEPQNNTKKDSSSRDILKGLDFPLQVGEVCEIFDDAEKYWKLATIMSMTLEKDFYIVNVKKTNMTVRVAAVNIRRPQLKEKKTSTAKTSNNLTVRKPAAVIKPRNQKPEPESRNDWKKFSEKLIKK